MPFSFSLRGLLRRLPLVRHCSLNHHPAGARLSVFRYIGPGLLVTVGFIDPGNWAANLTSSRKVMGEYANGPWTVALLAGLIVVVTVLNVMLFVSAVRGR